MKTILGDSDFSSISDIQKSQRDKILAVYGKTDEILKAEKEKVEAKNLDIDDFKHHRLMAGYHSSTADKIDKEALHLHSATNADLHGVAKEKKGEAMRHRKAADEHREKAKSFHNKDKHGEWNETIPNHLDALKYGSKQSKNADKKTNLIEKEEDMETDYKKEDKNDEVKTDKKAIKKSELFEILGVRCSDIEKSGEGSRGGKVISHTSSGKAIYENSKHESHKKFSKEDHEEKERDYSKIDSKILLEMSGKLLANGSKESMTMAREIGQELSRRKSKEDNKK